jgi:hypothetical protein
MNNMDEIWKDIINYEGLYQISNYGRVKSLAKIRKSSKVSYSSKERLLSLTKNNGNGYLICCLCDGMTKKNHYFHRLVARHFINKPEGCDVVNHIDANRKNNKVENLEWVTTKENIHHTIKLGRKTDIGVNSPNTHLVENDVIEIYKLAISGKVRQYDIGAKFNITQSAVSCIKMRKTHKATVSNYLESIE